MKTLYMILETNDAYAAIAGTSLYSLYKNNKDIESLEVYLINDGISDDNIKKFRKVADDFGRNLTLIDSSPMEKILSDAGVAMYKGSYTTYYKLFAVNMFPEDAEYVFFIDSDTVVCGSLMELLDWDFNGAPMAMTWEMVPEVYKEHLGLKKNDTFYNGGAILFNRKKWREGKYEERLLEYMRENHPSFLFADQELQNVMFHNEIQLLPLKYNLHTTYFLYPHWQLKEIYHLYDEVSFSEPEIKEAKENPVIYHLVGNGAICRPWFSNNHHPLTGIFDSYLQQTPWKDMKKGKMKRGIIGHLQYILYVVLPKKLYAKVHYKMITHFLTHADKA